MDQLNKKERIHEIFFTIQEFVLSITKQQDTYSSLLEYNLRPYIQKQNGDCQHHNIHYLIYIF